MNGSLAMRSTRLRTLLLILVGGGMLLSLYLLTSSQYHLKDARHLLETCQQQKDSLLAQLQVVYEQKNRVEKSLQQEKLEHRKTQEDNQKNNFLRLQVQKAKAEVDTKLSALQKEQQSLQDRYHELESQIKDLREQQTQSDEKRTKLQADYELNLKNKDEENNLLRGNYTLVLQERDNLENQNMQLNHNIQQMKSDFLHYKRLYLDISQRLKRLNEVKTTKTVPDIPKVVENRGESLQKEVTVQAVPTTKVQQENQQMSNDVLNHSDNLQGHVSYPAQPQKSPEQRHPLQPPDSNAHKGDVEANDVAQKSPLSVAGLRGDQEEPEAAGAGQPPPNLRQQLPPPDFGPEHAQHPAVESSSVANPVQVAVSNQPLLPPPPQEAKAAESQHQDPLHQNQEEPAKLNQGFQSQEQKDQDTMARKPILEQNPLAGGLAPELQGNERLFVGGAVPWNPFGDLGMPALQQQQQVKLPEVKAKSNNNNNRPQEEEENYPEDGDDDNGEEQDDIQRGDKNNKPMPDHDFEDNDGNDHNQAKEEGIVIAPK